MSQRTHFINPYTFIPLKDNGPCITTNESSDSTHAWLKNAPYFTGVIHCQLKFITPAVIPGDQHSGDDDGPGEIQAYSYDGNLAIPGSRIRGHLLNLMRAINSSPVPVPDRSSDEDRLILDREKGNHKIGFISIDNNGNLIIQEIIKKRNSNSPLEILVASSQRTIMLELANGISCNTAIPARHPKNTFLSYAETI